MYQSTILPLAKEDIRQTAIWYNKKRQGLGKNFTAEVREKVLFIRQNPRASRTRYQNVRSAVLKMFPYMIYYTIDEPNKTIIVHAVLHTSRDPGLLTLKRKP